MSPVPPPGSNWSPSQRDIAESDARFRRSNAAGDDLATKIVFVVIVLAIVGWVVFAWMNRVHTMNHPLPQLQRRS
jgi:hypothetical protein